MNSEYLSDFDEQDGYLDFASIGPASKSARAASAGLLDAMDTAGLPWGIVTNKPMRMTLPLLAGLGLAQRSACAISGDTLPQRKPEPAPLLLASEQTGVPAERCIYVWDAPRDIDAGRSAGMLTVAAAYGYINDEDPYAWGADHVVADTAELTTYLAKAVNLKA